MEILGHSSYQLTMNTYSHVAPELNNEAAQLMAGALWDVPGPPLDGQGPCRGVVRGGLEPPTPRFSGVTGRVRSGSSSSIPAGQSHSGVRRRP